MNTPSFNQDHCDRLLALGVIQTQINALKQTLVGVAVLTQRWPALNDVRTELSEVAKHVDRAQQAIESMITASGSGAKSEVQGLLQKLSWEASPRSDGQELARALVTLKALRRLIEEAEDVLSSHPQGEGRKPIPQRRGNQAAARPIQLIHNALVLGWRGPDAAGPFPFSPIDSGDAFASVVRICYEAIDDDPDNDRERAIKAYRRWLSKQRAALSTERDLVDPHPEPKDVR